MLIIFASVDFFLIESHKFKWKINMSWVYILWWEGVSFYKTCTGKVLHAVNKRTTEENTYIEISF